MGGEATTVGMTVLLRNALFFFVVVVTFAVGEGDAAFFFLAMMLVLGLGLCVGLLCRWDFLSGSHIYLVSGDGGSDRRAHSEA